MPYRPDAPTVLARHGIEPGPRGYDLGTLSATIAERHWQYCTEARGPGYHGSGRYRALVFVRGEGIADSRFVTMLAARGQGETEEAALAQALARMLVRDG